MRLVSSFTVGQAAELLNVSPDTVRRWVDSGQIPAARSAGGRRRVDGEGLARFSAERAPTVSICRSPSRPATTSRDS